MINDERAAAEIEDIFRQLFTRVTEGATANSIRLLTEKAVSRITRICDADAAMLRRWIGWAVTGMEMGLTPWGAGEFASALTGTLADGWSERKADEND